MIRYIAQRLLHAIPVLFGVSLITFLLTYLLPADPARMYAGPNASIETVIAFGISLAWIGHSTSSIWSTSGVC